MTTQSLQEFVGRHSPSAAGLAALAAALDAKLTGVPLEPKVAKRVEELLAVLGASNVLDDLPAPEAAPVLSMLRAMTLLDAKLLFSHTRTTTWTVDDPEVLQAIGDAARMHAHALTKAVIPACDGLGERLRAPGGAFLDIGVGVAATAIAFAQMWPGVRVVGIDPWQPSLRLARENVEGANMKDRIELREQGGEQLEDDAAFDLAWMAIPFMPERAIRVATERTLRALRPGGWAVLAPANFAAMPPPVAAVFRLRTSQWGGPEWTPADVEELLREKGYVEVQTAPSPPGSPAAFVVGRRRPV